MILNKIGVDGSGVYAKPNLFSRLTVRPDGVVVEKNLSVCKVLFGIIYLTYNLFSIHSRYDHLSQAVFK